MSGNKTAPTEADPMAFLQSVESERRRRDGVVLEALFRRVTGFNPVMWGPSIIGYGSYVYRYESGRTGEFLATGFSPRKSNLVIYILPGYSEFGPILKDLGKHRLGRSCLYINKLADVDTDVLARLVRAGLDELNAIWPVRRS